MGKLKKGKVYSSFQDNIRGPLKDKKGVTIVSAFQNIFKKSNRKLNKIRVGKGSDFYNNSFKKWLRNNDIVMHSTQNEGKSVAAERFFKTLKKKLQIHDFNIKKYAY